MRRKIEGEGGEGTALQARDANEAYCRGVGSAWLTAS